MEGAKASPRGARAIIGRNHTACNYAQTQECCLWCRKWELTRLADRRWSLFQFSAFSACDRDSEFGYVVETIAGACLLNRTKVVTNDRFECLPRFSVCTVQPLSEFNGLSHAFEFVTPARRAYTRTPASIGFIMFT